MTNTLYQSTVEALEVLLSPRVVSRSLKEGLRQVGRSPDTADINDIETILKAQVYRQLQLSMPVTEAKTTVNRLIEELQSTAAPVGSVSDEVEGGLEAQQQQLAELQVALRPFNLYFEWPEVQKLRSQVQLLQSDHEAGRESPDLISRALQQLEVVKQKLEDQLVLQARDLAEINDALDEVRHLSDPKVRRLETLVNQVRATQEGRQLASAEVERARRLARELRISLESVRDDKAVEAPDGPAGVGHGAIPAADTEAASDPALDVAGGSIGQGAFTSSLGNATSSSAADVSSATPTNPVEPHEPMPATTEALHHPSTDGLEPAAADGRSERLHRIDIDAELHELRSLEADNAEVLNFHPGLATNLAELRAELLEGRSVAAVVADLRTDLESTQRVLRDDLREELEELLTAMASWSDEVDVTELSQAARVTIGILTTSLPSLADVDHVRRLAQLARERNDALLLAGEQQAEQLEEQERLLARLEATLLNRTAADEQVSEEVERLRAEYDSLRSAQEHQTVAPEVVAAVRQAEERLAQSLAERATERSERRRARLAALRAQLERLPVTDTLSERAEGVRLEIERLLAEQESADAVAALLLDEQPEPLDLPDGDVEVIGEVVDGIRVELLGSLRGRLLRLTEQAAALGNKQLLERLQAAAAALDEERYPDLKQLQAAIRREHEAQRLEQVDELHRLAVAAAPFTSQESEGALELRDLLTTAREELEQGGLARHLAAATELLAKLSSDAEQRLASVPGRLDAALSELETVAKLNSEDVATVTRVLKHLDSQRDSLPLLSPGMRLQLEGSLTSAEELLEKLQGEYQATRVIADQLVSGGLLDGVLGMFRSDADPLRQGGGEAVSIAPESRLQAYLSEEGVTGAALLSASGALVSGSLRHQPTGLSELRAAAGLSVGADSVSIMAVEHGAGLLLLGWLTSGDSLAIELADRSLQALLTNRLRRDLADLDNVST